MNQAFADNKIEIESEDAFFISFNYTLALENLYNIYSSRILHIHGCLNDDEYIIGHGRAYDEVKEKRPSLTFLCLIRMKMSLASMD